MENQVKELKIIIEKAKETINVFKPNGKYFSNYTFEFNDPIGDIELKSLEEKYSINLPSEYKDYIVSINNGGNQPLCGMFTVQQSLAILNKESPTKSVLADSDLSSKYCRMFHYNRGNSDSDSFDNTTLDDYFDYSNRVFNYQHLLLEGDIESFDRHEDDMKKHLLIFSFSDVVHTEYAIALDGNYAGKVVYYTYESKHNIKVTNMIFIEWMIGFYKHALECKPGYFTSIENI